MINASVFRKLVPPLVVIGFLVAIVAAVPSTTHAMTVPDWMVGFALVGALKTGTMDMASLLANESIAASGEVDLAQVNDVLQADVAAHNAVLADALNEIAEPSTERLIGEGTSDAGQMVEGDENTRPPTQRPGGIVARGLPLKQFHYAIGWTRDWLEQHTVAEMARATQAAEKAHLKKVQAELKRAIFLSANYTHFDHLQAPNINLDVKRFWNGDGEEMPEGPYGEVFDGSTHSHFLATATLTTVGATAFVRTLIEHGYGQKVRAVIAQADETAWRALSGFQAYPDPRFVLGSHANQMGQRVDITRLDNRAIGTYDAAEIWVKPWGTANYAFGYDTEGPKPIAFRERVAGGRGLRSVAEIDLYPWQVKYYRAQFGFGVKVRGNGAVYQFSNASYQDPTISG